MTKKQLFEKLDFEHGDKIHIIVAKKVVRDGIEKTRETRINHGFNIYELFGMFIKLIKDIEMTFVTKDDSDVEVKKIAFCDEIKDKGDPK